MKQAHSTRTSGEQALRRSRWLVAGVIALTLVVLAGVIWLARQQLRAQLREQISGRDAQVLYAFWLSQQVNDPTASIAALTDNPADHLTVILEKHNFGHMPQRRGTRLFDNKGQFVFSEPEDMTEVSLSPVDLTQLQRLKPVSRYHPAARLADLTLTPPEPGQTDTSPLLEVLLPLHAIGQEDLLAVAQFFLDGTEMAAEFAALDRSLTREAVAAFCAVGLVLATALGLAFRQLHRTNSLLAQRTQSLLEANQELSMAAKTAAVGAVTAHLIHGLKNPLSGLQNFVAGRGNGNSDEGEPDWDLAFSTTRRMQTLINETVRVLREHDSEAQYELSLEELTGLLASRLGPSARQAGVDFQTRVTGEASFPNRDANLILLILENLTQNAIQATPQGRAVSVEIERGNDAITCRVSDGGNGLPNHLKGALFKPCQSTKEGGSGLGLAISKQLSNVLGAELELTSSTALGCVFTLKLPAKLDVAGSST